MLLCLAAGAEAQSLAGVARAQADRVSAVRSPARAYTNSDLAAVPVEAARQPTSAPRDPAAELEVAVRPALNLDDRGEDYWRQRARPLRARVDRAGRDAAALEARVRSLDAAPGSGPHGERLLTVGALDRARSDALALDEEWLGLERQARLANVPLTWLR